MGAVPEGNDGLGVEGGSTPGFGDGDGVGVGVGLGVALGVGVGVGVGVGLGVGVGDGVGVGLGVGVGDGVGVTSGPMTSTTGGTPSNEPAPPQSARLYAFAGHASSSARRANARTVNVTDCNAPIPVELCTRTRLPEWLDDQPPGAPVAVTSKLSGTSTTMQRILVNRSALRAVRPKFVVEPVDTVSGLAVRVHSRAACATVGAMRNSASASRTDRRRAGITPRPAGAATRRNYRWVPARGDRSRGR